MHRKSLKKASFSFKFMIFKDFLLMCKNALCAILHTRKAGMKKGVEEQDVSRRYTLRGHPNWDIHNGTLHLSSK